MSTWLVSNPRITEGMRTRVMADDELQDYLAEYFAAPELVTDGTELVIRKADYLGRAGWVPPTRNLRVVAPFGDFEVHGTMTGSRPPSPTPLGI